MKRYEIHLHTKYSSCSNNSLKKILDVAKKKGLSGIAVTDHNTIEGALKLKKLNSDKNFEIIVGEEVYTDIGHVLVYYVKKEIKPGKFEDVLKEVRRQKAIIVLAHPYNILTSKIGKLFRVKNTRGNLETGDEKIVKKFDAIEVFNSRCLFKKENKMAEDIAKKYGKPMVAGSDAHFSNEIGLSYVEFDDGLDLRKAILQNKIRFHGKKGFAFYNRAKSAILMRFK